MVRFGTNREEVPMQNFVVVAAVLLTAIALPYAVLLLAGLSPDLS